MSTLQIFEFYRILKAMVPLHKVSKPTFTVLGCCIGLYSADQTSKTRAPPLVSTVIMAAWYAVCSLILSNQGAEVVRMPSLGPAGTVSTAHPLTSNSSRELKNFKACSISSEVDARSNSSEYSPLRKIVCVRSADDSCDDQRAQHAVKSTNASTTAMLRRLILDSLCPLKLENLCIHLLTRLLCVIVQVTHVRMAVKQHQAPSGICNSGLTICKGVSSASTSSDT